MELQCLRKTFIRGRFFAQTYEAGKNVRSVGRTSPTKGMCHQRTVFISAVYTVAPPKRRKINMNHFCYGYPLPVLLHWLLSVLIILQVPLRHEVGTSYHCRTMGSFSLSSISFLFSEGRGVTDCIT